MGDYWQAMFPSLPEIAKARGKQLPENPTPDFVYEMVGGKQTFYMPLYRDMLLRSLSKTAWPQEPMFTADFGVVETNHGFTLSCLVYFLPKAHFVHGIEPIEVSGIEPVDEAKVEQSVEQSLQVLRASKSMEREKTGVDAVIEDGDMVWCTLDAKIDGKPWAAGTMQKARIIVAKDRLQPLALYEAFLGKGVGNHQIEFVLTEKFGPLTGKLVKADLVVFAILSYVLPDWSDELAQQFGKPTIEELRHEKRAAARAKFIELWEGRVADAALAKLVERVEFDPLPTEWVKDQAKDRFGQLLQRARGDTKKVLDALGVPDEDTALLRLYETARNEAWAIIALLSYGEHVGIERDKDETMGNLTSYIRRAIKHLIDHNVVVCDG